jgi:hypothetical protein
LSFPFFKSPITAKIQRLLHFRGASDLPIEPEALQAFALEQNRLAWVLWEQLESLQHQIAQLNRARFDFSSERLAGQAELFDAASDLPVPPEPAKVPVEGHTRKGRPALPKDLPGMRVEYDLSDEQKAAPIRSSASARSAARRCTTSCPGSPSSSTFASSTRRRRPVSRPS